MRKWRAYISLFMLVGLSLTTIYQSTVIVHFYINQEEIIANHCINKDLPELNCKGKCHLKAELQTVFPEQATDTIPQQRAESALIFFGFISPNNACTLLGDEIRLISLEKLAMPLDGHPRKLNQPPELLS